MAGKKADAKKKTTTAPEQPEQTEGTATALETQEQTEGTAPAPKTPERAEDPDQEPETPEQAEDPDQEPDMFDKIPNPCVYCGPSVKGVARQYTTYHGGIPDALREFIKEHPQALGLIVSVEGFQAMRKRLETRGTLEEKLYKAVKAEL